MEEKPKEAWEECLEILKELSEDLGFDPETQTFSNHKILEKLKK